MPNLTTSADIDALMASANNAAARTNLGLTALATTTPGTGVAAALAINVGSAGAFLTFNGNAGTPSALVGTNITGTAAGLTAGTASAVAVGGITGLGTGVGTFLATPSGANLATALTTALPASKGGTGLTSLGTGVATWLGTPSSANLLAAITDETGSGALVFGTSPTFTTSVVAGGTTIALFNTVATTVNAFGVATTLNIGAAAATVLNFGGFTSAAELRFLEPSGSGTNYSGFKQAALAASITYTLPTDAPANGDVLTSQSNGTLSWETPSGAANAVTAASTAASAGLLWISAGADRSAEATDTVDDIITTNLSSGNLTLAGTLVTATGAELNFVDGVTSAIQTQIDGKQPLDSDLTSWAGVTRASGFDTFVATPSGANLASLLTTALPASKGGTGLTALGTNVATALGVNVGSAGAFITFNGAGGTPSSMVGTNITGLVPANIVAGTLGGNITLGESTGQILLDTALSADGTWSGICVVGTSGYTQAFGDVVYLDPTDSRWEACDANSAAGADGDCRGNIGMVVVAGTDGNTCTILRFGKIRADANFPSFTVNNPIYISETAGDVTQTQPTTTDVVIRIIGAALTADEMFFNPDNMWITHT